MLYTTYASGCNMSKEKFEIEYLLKNVSLTVLWNAIGTPLGLSEWFADAITVNGNEYKFTWEKHDQIAKLVAIKPNTFIRFQWEEDTRTDAYFELTIAGNKLTGELALCVTDFAEPNEKADAILLWNQQIDQMKRKKGL
jgi:uncharacterized protein YndB with AHSA1/START domain